MFGHDTFCRVLIVLLGNFWGGNGFGILVVRVFDVGFCDTIYQYAYSLASWDDLRMIDVLTMRID